MLGPLNIKFLYGVSTAAYQIEGGVIQDNREPSIWDTFTHLPNKIYNNDNADIACNSYNQYHEDISLIRELGCDAYRFSISWSRIIHTADRTVNEAGVAHYSDLIDELLRYGIAPFVTLYHWDLPDFLEREYGGWLSPQIQTDFVAYAAVGGGGGGGGAPPEFYQHSAVC